MDSPMLANHTGQLDMTAEQIRVEVEKIRRERLPFMLIKTFTWYRAMTYDERVEVEEAIGFCVGGGPMTPEAYAIAKLRLVEIRSGHA